MLANVFDYLATNHAVLEHGATELNPIMAPLIGTPWFILVKTVVPGAILYYVLPRRQWHWALVVGTIIMLAVATWNVIGAAA